MLGGVMGNVRIGLIARTAAAAFLMTVASHGAAQAAKAKNACFDVAMGLAGDDSGLADQAAACETASNALDVQKFDGAVSAYNAARANNQRAAFATGSAGGAYYSNATRLIAASRTLVDDSVLPQSGKLAPAAAQLRTGRALENARALVAMAKAQGATCPSNAPCAEQLRLAGGELGKIPAPGVNEKSQFVQFYATRADMYLAMGQRNLARADLAQIATSPNAAYAQTQLSRFFIEDIDSALGADNVNPDSLRSALGGYNAVLAGDPSVQVRRGKAYLKLAELDKVGEQDSYQTAATAFKAAIDSASSAGWNATRADAYLGQGQALFGLRRNADAEKSLDQAAALEPNKPERLIALGAVYSRAGSLNKADPNTSRTYWTKADNYFRSAGSPLSWRGSNADVIDALMAWADAKDGLRMPYSQVIDTYKFAEARDPTSPRPKYLIGKKLFESGKGDLARPYLDGAIIRASALAAPELARARHYRSVIRARDALRTGATKALWSDIAMEAEQAARGASDPAYAYEVCLIRIVSPEDAASSCVDNGTAEGALLKGMALLDAARGVPPSARQGLMQFAQQAFSSASESLKDYNSTPSFQPLQWGNGFAFPETLPTLRVLLEYGKARVPSCYGMDVKTSLTSAEIAAAQNFYIGHRVNDC